MAVLTALPTFRHEGHRSWLSSTGSARTRSPTRTGPPPDRGPIPFAEVPDGPSTDRGPEQRVVAHSVSRLMVRVARSPAHTQQEIIRLRVGVGLRPTKPRKHWHDGRRRPGRRNTERWPNFDSAVRRHRTVRAVGVMRRSVASADTAILRLSMSTDVFADDALIDALLPETWRSPTRTVAAARRPGSRPACSARRRRRRSADRAVRHLARRDLPRPRCPPPPGARGTPFRSVAAGRHRQQTAAASGVGHRGRHLRAAHRIGGGRIQGRPPGRHALARWPACCGRTGLDSVAFAGRGRGASWSKPSTALDARPAGGRARGADAGDRATRPRRRPVDMPGVHAGRTCRSCGSTSSPKPNARQHAGHRIGGRCGRRSAAVSRRQPARSAHRGRNARWPPRRCSARSWKRSSPSDQPAVTDRFARLGCRRGSSGHRGGRRSPTIAGPSPSAAARHRRRSVAGSVDRRHDGAPTASAPPRPVRRCQPTRHPGPPAGQRPRRPLDRSP